MCPPSRNVNAITGLEIYDLGAGQNDLVVPLDTVTSKAR
jgi:hypothetical protein